MTDLVTNDKQAMQALKQHGGNIVTVILVVVAAFFGWQYYQKHYAKIDTQAADLYSTIQAQNEQLAALANDPAQKTQYDSQQEALFGQIDQLAQTHGDTVYAWQALMTKARLLADRGDYQAVVDSLSQAQAINLDDDGLKAISTLQLMRAYLALDDTDKAQALANQPLPQSFEASRLEILGDIYVLQDDKEAAKATYTKAWDLLSERHENRSLLRLKMQSLGLKTAKIDKPAIVQADNANQAINNPTPSNTNNTLDLSSDSMADTPTTDNTTLTTDSPDSNKE